MNKKKQQLYYSFIENLNNKYLKLKITPEIDAHIHTTFSDGSFDILDIINMAKIIGLKKLVITDHNTILPAYKYLITISHMIPTDIDISIGSEIACKFFDDKYNANIPIEILAYNVNPEKLQYFIDAYPFNKNESQEKHLKMLMNMCIKHDLVFSKDLSIPAGKFATEVLCRELIRHEENKEFFMNTHPIVWTSPKLFFKKFCANPTSEFYIDSTGGIPTYNDTIEAILDCGGIPILAHPCIYIYENYEDVERMMNTILNNSNIAGFEAYHGSHTNFQRELIAKFAKSNDKIVSGGTDFHSGPQTILGFGNLNDPLELKLDMFSWLK